MYVSEATCVCDMLFAASCYDAASSPLNEPQLDMSQALPCKTQYSVLSI